MGNSSNPQHTLVKGEGYRIISVRRNSPLQEHVDIFFDFIIDVTPVNPPERKPSQILDKLSDKQPKPQPKNLMMLINQYEGAQVIFKIISTKWRQIRTVTAVPNNKWNGSTDLLGVQLRKQRYDEAFDTYFPIMEIVSNSPIKKSGIVEGEYLLGTTDFKYTSLNELIDTTYDRFFDKEVPDKNLNCAIYNLLRDEVRIVPVLMKRGWGGKGLLGCQFMQGYLYKFPANLKEKREGLLEQQKEKEKSQKIRQELKGCDGASRSLVESLKQHRKGNGGNSHLKQIHKLLSVAPPALPTQSQPVFRQKQASNQQMKMGVNPEQSAERIEILERKVVHLEGSLSSIKDYIQKMVIRSEQPAQLQLQEIGEQV